ncbi:MAG: hypothetical protein R2940_09900 [Syntrophotaleaceae bacterium]
MKKYIEISTTTLKRLQNYQQVVENERRKAHKHQWMEMTLVRMEEYQQVQKKSDHANAVVGYASFIFRIQNGLTPPRTLYGEQILRNALVSLLEELEIPIKMIEVPETETVNSR